MNADVIWGKACEHLQSTLSADVYSRWISVIEPDLFDQKTLSLRVANNFYQSWLEENYLPLIEDAIRVETGETVKVMFSVDNSIQFSGESEAQDAAASKPMSATATASKSRSGSPMNPNYTFDKFVVGSSNSFPHAASLAVAQSPGRAYNPLFLYGGVGLGKTHLMQAIGNHAFEHANLNVAYVSCEAFTNEYIDALQRQTLVKFRRKYRNMDMLLIDDIQFLGGKERMQEEFFHTFNALFDAHKQIVLTCDRPACEIPGLEHRLVSRFEWGLVTELEPPDVETRIAILRKKQEQLKVKLPPEVLNYIAESIKANIRRLEGAMIRVVSYGSLTGKEITLDVVEYLLRDTLDQEKHNAITLEEIQKVVADFYDIRMGDMISNRRPQNIAFPRQIAMYLCREITSKSLPAIGTAFGKNHATVIHACRSVGTKLKADPSLRQSLMVLQQRIQKRGGPA